MGAYGSLVIAATLGFGSAAFSQGDSLVEVIPLAVGNSWVYEFQGHRFFYKPPIALEDSGSSLVSISGREEHGDTAVWHVEEHLVGRRRVHGCDFGCFDTTFTLDSTFSHSFQELLSGQRRLFNNCNPSVGDVLDLPVFSFGCLGIPDTGFIFRYSAVDSAGMTEIVRYDDDRVRWYTLLKRSVGVLADTAWMNQVIISWRYAELKGFTVGTGRSTGGRLPEVLELSQNFPNPFNPSTTIEYSLPHAAAIRLEVFNVLGERVALPDEGPRPPGRHEVWWDATGMPTGAYVLRLTAAGAAPLMRMMTLVR